jgi:hypothetical protein
MPDGASDDERQRNKSKGFGNDVSPIIGGALVSTKCRY